MVAHGDTSVALRSDASHGTLERLDVLSRQVSGSVSNLNDDDTVQHTLEMDSIVAEKALSPALFQAFRETPVLMICVFVGAMNFLCYGYETGIIGNVQTMKGYKAAMGLTTANKATLADANGWVTSSLNLTAGCFCLFVGYISDYLGRKKAMYIGCTLNIVGNIIQAAATSLGMMIAGRCIVGAALGILISTGAPYIMELSYKSIRGFVGILCSLMVTFGLFIAACVAYGFVNSSNYDNNSFRWVLGIQAALAIAVLIMLIPLPESPRWLVSKGRDLEARKSLLRFRKDQVVGNRIRRITRSRTQSVGSEHEFDAIPPSMPTYRQNGGVELEHEPLTAVDVELISIIEDVQHWKKVQESQGIGMQTLVRKDMALRTSIAAMLPIAQQVSGQSLILWYGPSIYASIGLNAQRAALIQTAVLFGATILCLGLVDRIGRRALMLLGTIGTCGMMLAVAITFQTTFQAPATRGMADAIWGFIIIFEFFYANSWAAIPFMFASEIYPNSVRSFGVAWSSSIKYFAAFAISKAAPIMLLTWGEGGISPSGTYFFFGGAGILTFLYVFTNVAETKGMPLEKVDSLFGLTTWAQYRSYVWDNIRYNGSKHLRELKHISLETAKETSMDEVVAHQEGRITPSERQMLTKGQPLKEELQEVEMQKPLAM